MRLFIAIDLPEDVLLRFERLLATLRPEAPIHWSPLDNLHITTKFIGAWPEAKLDDLHAALQRLQPRDSFPVELRELGWFPSARSPRTLWAGVQGGTELPGLAADLEDVLLPLGIARETRAYVPHLTLARIKGVIPLRRLKEKVEQVQPVCLGAFGVSQFALYSSEAGSNASLYRRLHTYRLASARAAS